jgi:hypothetical protein
MVDLLAFLDEVDRLCDDLPEWYPMRAERIERIREHALQLCRQCLKDQAESEQPDEQPNDDQDDYF